MNGIYVTEPRIIQDVIRPHGERRRLGRPYYENPDLITLLRNPASMEFGSAADVLSAEGKARANNAVEQDDDDQLTAAKGIFVSVLLSLGFWIIIGAAIRFL
jgi:hypothetical protein